jgi:hypothetical protein
LPVRRRIGLKSAYRFLERAQQLGSVSIKARAFGRQLQRSRRSGEERDPEAFFQALDGPADPRRINEQTARRCDKAAALDDPHEDLDHADAWAHANSPREIVDIFALLTCVSLAPIASRDGR